MQSGPHTGLYVENTASKGLGLFCQSGLSTNAIFRWNWLIMLLELGLTARSQNHKKVKRLANPLLSIAFHSNESEMLNGLKIGIKN